MRNVINGRDDRWVESGCGGCCAEETGRCKEGEVP
jgi:hypothetical protein